MERVFEYVNGQIKLMYNEVPSSKDYETYAVTDVIQRDTCQIEQSFSIGIEYKCHVGGRMLYGLLLADVAPCQIKNTVNVIILYTKGNSIHFDGSLLLNDAHVYKGLPKEYLEGVRQSVLESVRCRQSFPQCDLVFCSSANCEIGSSPALFGKIAKVIVKMVHRNSFAELQQISTDDFTEKYCAELRMQSKT